MSAKVSRRELARVITAKLLHEPKRQKHWMRALAAYLVQNNMIDNVDMLVNDIAHEVYAQSGTLTVEITSAKRLSDTLRNDIQKFMRAHTDAKHVTVHESIDPELVGGFIARTPDAELDASVQTRLRKLAMVA